MRIAGWLAAAVVIVHGDFSPAWAGPACSPTAAPLLSVTAAASALQQAGAKRDDMDTDVGVDERKALQAFKQALVEGVEQRMTCASPDAQAAELESDLATALSATPASKPLPESSIAPGFGQELRIGAGSNAAHPGLLLVQLGFAIPCGDDNMLLGYRVENDRWTRVLRWQSEDYDSISGAFGAPFEVLSLTGGQVAVVHGTPWCTSTWSRLGLDLLQPAQAEMPQKVLYHLDHGYKSDEDVSLAARPGGFELRAEVGMLDTDLLTRQGIFRYRTEGGTVKRIQPAARNGRDFVDEWLQVEEPLARAWSDPAAASRIMQARAGLMKDKPSSSYGPVRACKDRARQYQVEIGLGDSGADLRRYALLRQEANGFTVLGFGSKADPACKGPDLMRQ